MRRLVAFLVCRGVVRVRSEYEHTLKGQKGKQRAPSKGPPVWVSAMFVDCIRAHSAIVTQGPLVGGVILGRVVRWGVLLKCSLESVVVLR